MGMARVRMKEMIERLEKERGRSIPNSVIAEGAGVPASTIGDLKKGHTTQISFHTLGRIYAYFNRELGGISMDELIEATDEDVYQPA